MDPHYRVALFGSARLREEDPEYRDVFRIARGLAELGFDVVTGGGPGLMQAANAGFKAAGRPGGHSIGLNIRLPHEQELNPFLDIKKEFERFSGRLDTFVSLSDAAVVAPGGIGTLLELFYTWQLVQVGHLCETPIVLFGPMWAPLLGWLRSELVGRRLADPMDLRHVFHARSAEDVLTLLRRTHEDRGKLEHICVNYDRYRTELGLEA